MIFDSVKSLAKSIKARVDATITPSATYIPSAWRNLVTGLGGSSDPLSYHLPETPTVLSHEILQNLYDGDNFATRIVSANPKEAFRKGFFVTYRGDSEREQNLVDEVSARAKKIKLADRAYLAALLGRLHGGSALLPNTTDEELDGPFPLGQEIYSLAVLDAREITPQRFYDPRSDQANTRFNDHGIYQADILVGSTNQILDIHPSRLCVFGGVPTPRKDRWEKYLGWDSSILQQTWNTIRVLSNDILSKSAMMRDASVGVLKIHRLWDLLAKDYQDMFQTRMEIGHYTRNSMRLLPIDSEDDFVWVERSFAGIKDMIEVDMYLVSSAAEMPVTVLFGRSPAGQNSTGEHDTKNWHAIVESSQKQQYNPAVETIVQRIAASLGAQDLDHWGVEWYPLEILSSEEERNLEKLVAETDLLRVQMGIDEGELIRHRYGQGEYRQDPPNFDPEIIDEWIAESARWQLPPNIENNTENPEEEDDDSEVASSD